MAILQTDTGVKTEEEDVISQLLAPLHVQIKTVDLAANLFSLVKAQDIFSDIDKFQILDHHRNCLESSQVQEDYLWSDFLVMHPGSPKLASFELSYSRYHIHKAPEVLYVLDGELLFRIVSRTGRKFQLLLQAQDFLYLPGGIEHCSALTAKLMVKAIRYFNMADGWMPYYTRRQMQGQEFSQEFLE